MRPITSTLLATGVIALGTSPSRAYPSKLVNQLRNPDKWEDNGRCLEGEQYMEIKGTNRLKCCDAFTMTWRQVTDGCTRPVEHGFAATGHFNASSNGNEDQDLFITYPDTRKNDRSELAIYTCAPHGYYELEIGIEGNRIDQSDSLRAMHWKVVARSKEKQIWDTWSDTTERKENGKDKVWYTPIGPGSYTWPLTNEMHPHRKKMWSGPKPKTCADSYIPAATSREEPHAPEWFKRLGCFEGSNTKRVLQGVSTSSDQMTAEYCGRWCKEQNKAYEFFGTEFGTDCFCDNHLEHKDKIDDGECDKACSGDETVICGGHKRINVFLFVEEGPEKKINHEEPPAVSVTDVLSSKRDRVTDKASFGSRNIAGKEDINQQTTAGPRRDLQDRDSADTTVGLRLSTDDQNSGRTLVVSDTPGLTESEEGGGEEDGVTEDSSIRRNHIPFLQRHDEWQVAGHGVSMTATGEPKSGTTWLGRLIPQLALELCGSSTNPWCEMGGLTVTANVPAPRYEFEMLNKADADDGRPALFLHFKGSGKHLIPGMNKKDMDEKCTNRGRYHASSFQDNPPCRSKESPTRARLTACLWDTSTKCLRYMSRMDPADIRSAVIVRDPRNIVMSERRMRAEVFNTSWVKEMSLNDFVRKRFEENHLGLVDVAAFMGLTCTPEQAYDVWLSHQNASPHDDFTHYELPMETLEWMNATMARLLPEPVALRWGVTPTDL